MAIKTFKETLAEYKADLEYLTVKSMVADSDEEYKTIKHIINQVRFAWFSKYATLIRTYFFPFDYKFNDPDFQNYDTFLADNLTKAISNFNGFYYLVDVESYNLNGILSLKHPDEYLLDGIRLTGEQYPEFIMANYFIDNGLCS